MLSFEKHIHALRDATLASSVRRAAVATLAKQVEIDVVPFLIEALTYTDSMVRREATKGLQSFNATTALEPLLQALKVEDNDLTAWTIMEAVGELGNPNALPTLRSFQNADALLTRIAANKCVARIEARFPGGALETSPFTEASTPVEEQEISQKELSEAAQVYIHDETQDTLEIEASTEIRKASPSQTSSEVTDEKPLRERVENSEVSDNVEPIASEPIDVGIATDFSEAENNKELNENLLIEAAPSDVDTRNEDVELLDADIPTEDVELLDATPEPSRLVRQPVLVPNALTASCDPIGEYSLVLEQPRPSVFALLFRPGTYLSKRWLSRTRSYFALWCVLLMVTIGSILYEGHNESDTNSLTQFGFIGDASTEVQRALAAGDFYIQEGYYKQAINSYETSLHLGRIPIHYYKKLGFAYLMENQYALAVDAYEFFLSAHANQTLDSFTVQASPSPSRNPDYNTYNSLGTAYMKLGRLTNAKLHYEKAIAMAPEDGQAYNNLAHLYSNGYRQKLWVAEALAYKAILLNPGVAAYYDTLGWIQFQRGRMNRAISTLERAIRLQSDYIRAHYHLALVALKAKKRKKALKAIQTVLKNNPGFVHLNFQPGFVHLNFQS